MCENLCQLRVRKMRVRPIPGRSLRASLSENAQLAHLGASVRLRDRQAGRAPPGMLGRGPEGGVARSKPSESGQQLAGGVLDEVRRCLALLRVGPALNASAAAGYV